jgi:hypothetical protein
MPISRTKRRALDAVNAGFMAFFLHFSANQVYLAKDHKKPLHVCLPFVSWRVKTFLACILARCLFPSQKNIADDKATGDR